MYPEFQYMTKSCRNLSNQSKNIRPTSSKVREALFDILRQKKERNGYLSSAVFLDLYAGTGAVGIDALKQGAKKAVFVDISARAIKTVRQLSKSFDKNALQILKGKAVDMLRKLITDKILFDIIFIDPPYKSDEIEQVLPIVGKGEILNDSAYVVVEHLYKKNMPKKNGCLFLIKEYRYGDTMLTLYKKDVLYNE